jgi:hypothetical protein
MEEAAMMRPRRRSRAVYRIYGEEEYLAGLDALTDWDGPPAEAPAHGRRLHRIAGAAALTGAVGTVGGVVGLAVVHAHAADRRETAEHFGSSIATAVRRGSTSAASAGQASHRHVVSRSRSRGRHLAARTPVHVALARTRRPRAGASARAIAVSSPQDSPAPVASAVRDTSTEAPSAAQGTPTATDGDAQGASPATPEARPQAQSEFGFER